MTVLPLGFLGDFVSGGRSNLIGVIPARFRLRRNNETIRKMSLHRLVRSNQESSHKVEHISFNGENEETTV